MNQKPRGRTSSSEQIICDIKRKTRKQYSAEETIRIVLDGLRGEASNLLNVKERPLTLKKIESKSEYGKIVFAEKIVRPNAA